MIALLALALMQGQPALQRDEPATIIVTGRRIQDDRDALAACLKAQCPPLEDIAATLKYAENLFVAGNYGESHAVLSASIRRNGARGPQYPQAVSGLYRAHARVSIHLGEADLYRGSTHRIARVFAAAPSSSASDLALARIEVGDMELSLGDGRRAERSYLNVERQADAAGLVRISSLAKLRLAWLYNLMGRGPRAQQKLDELARSSDGQNGVYRLAARLLQARIARARGEALPTETLIEELSRQTGAGVTLLYSPQVASPVPLARDPFGPTISPPRVASEGFRNRWIDVGFWVRPDGTVQDADILRRSGNIDWSESVLRMIGGRRYAPFSQDDNLLGRYRIERYTYTSLYQMPPGSRIRTRTGRPRIESIDLTEDESAAAN